MPIQKSTIPPITLQVGLYDRLQEAATSFSVTDLRKAIAELEQTGDEGLQLAEMLRDLVNGYDMVGVEIDHG